MLTMTAIGLVLAACTLVGGRAWGQASDRASMLERIDTARTTTNKIRARKCRPTFRFRYVPVTTYPGARLQAGLNTWRTRLWRTRQAKSRCAQVHHLSLWLCVHAHEGQWDDPNDPYFGGLQMGRWFMGTYGARLYRSKGTADRWTPREQMAVADRAYHQAGHSSAWLNGQWPGTRSECGA